MEYLLSFSHEKTMEDIILYHVLGNKSSIFWIDVGANDPVFDSVTKFFSIRGGVGINIEPQPRYVQKYKEDRPDDVNLMIGISDKHEELNLYGKGELASFDVGNRQVRGIGFTKISVWTLKEVCDKYIQHNQEIHLLKIDVEGWEKQCLKGMDFKNYRPWILCIESTELPTGVPSYREWENSVTENGYVFAAAWSVNRYYVLSEKAEIIQRFKEISNLKKKYDITFYSERERYEKYIKILHSRVLAPLRLIRRCAIRLSIHKLAVMVLLKTLQHYL